MSLLSDCLVHLCFRCPAQAMAPPFQPNCKNAADASHFDNFPPEPLPDPEELSSLLEANNCEKS